MKERQNSIPESIKTALPLTPEELAMYRVINRGDVQVSLLKDQESVLHITQPLPSLSEDESTVVNRWLYEDKGEKIERLYTNIPKASIKVPIITNAGNIDIGGQRLSYWFETFIPGISLTQATFEGLPTNVYTKIVEWLAEFHDATEEKNTLSDYFKTRFGSLERLFSVSASDIHIGQAIIDVIKRVLDYGERIIDPGIGREEKVSKTHGDLRAENILIDKESIGIIDFEQGVNGGDWYSDIEKLLMLSSDEKPNPEKPQRYRPPLELNQKAILLDSYINKRRSKGWSVPEFFDGGFDRRRLQNRINVFNIDNTLSSLTYRLIRQRETQVQEDPSIQRLVNEVYRIKDSIGI